MVIKTVGSAESDGGFGKVKDVMMDIDNVGRGPGEILISLSASTDDSGIDKHHHGLQSLGSQDVDMDIPIRAEGRDDNAGVQPYRLPDLRDSAPPAPPSPMTVKAPPPSLPPIIRKSDSGDGEKSVMSSCSASTTTTVSTKQGRGRGRPKGSTKKKAAEAERLRKQREQQRTRQSHGYPHHYPPYGGHPQPSQYHGGHYHQHQHGPAPPPHTYGYSDRQGPPPGPYPPSQYSGHYQHPPPPPGGGHRQPPPYQGSYNYPPPPNQSAPPPYDYHYHSRQGPAQHPPHMQQQPYHYGGGHYPGGAPAPAPSAGPPPPQRPGPGAPRGGDYGNRRPHSSFSMAPSSSSAAAAPLKNKKKYQKKTTTAPPPPVLDCSSSMVSTGSSGKKRTIVDASAGTTDNKATLNSSGDTPSLMDDSPQKIKSAPPSHRRTHSNASSTSSLSLGGMSMSSNGKEAQQTQEGERKAEAFPKRRKGGQFQPLSTSSAEGSSNILSFTTYKRGDGQSTQPPTKGHRRDLSINSNATMGSTRSENMFAVTSPINSGANSKGGTKAGKGKSKDNVSNTDGVFRSKKESSEDKTKGPVRGNAKPSMMLSEGRLSEEQSLNHHLRTQSFTPLPLSASGEEKRGSDINSPTFNPALSSIAPQLSWSITDTPSLGLSADWDEAQFLKPSPRDSFLPFWKDDDSSQKSAVKKKASEGEQRSSYESILRLTTISPTSDSGTDSLIGGATTPLPFFVGSEERENEDDTESGKKQERKPLASPRMLKQLESKQPFSTGKEGPSPYYDRDSKDGNKSAKPVIELPLSSRVNPHSSSSSWGIEFTPSNIRRQHQPYPSNKAEQPNHQVQSPYHREDGYAARSHGGEPRPDYYSPRNIFTATPTAHSGYNAMELQRDRVRNLRGRQHPGSYHAPLPYSNSSSVHHQNLRSPMVGGFRHRGAPSNHPHRNNVNITIDLSSSKRKCVPLRPPIPSKFQGDMEAARNAPVPEFNNLVNFPMHVSQKQSPNLPEGIRCCVMCGQACPFTALNKAKKVTGVAGKPAVGGKAGTGLAPLNGNNQARPNSKAGGSSSGGGYAIIPTQNKGLCTLCDVNVWVVTQSGLEIKWCKGCKNFRPWASFGEKGLATKCVRCRERQREKYAIEKEKKERARLVSKQCKGIAS